MYVVSFSKLFQNTGRTKFPLKEMCERRRVGVDIYIRVGVDIYIRMGVDIYIRVGVDISTFV